MPKKIKVRFNLGRGENYMKWKLQFETHSEYYSPEEYNLAMFGCTLRNSKKTAQKIHSGAHKTVCAWILCDQVFLTQNIQLPEVEAELKYNPRFKPNWVAGDADADNASFDKIYSQGRRLFSVK